MEYKKKFQCGATKNEYIGYCDYCYLSGNKCEELERYLIDRGLAP